MNYFDSITVAERYKKGRPDFHSGTISHIRAFLDIESKLGNALDIACGTGLSTKALLPVAENVYGTDISRLMLNVACERDKIKYAVSAAESQPFGNDELDLVTVSSGVHWFNIDAFLREAHRILKRNAWLVLYENYFAAGMEGDQSFFHWVNDIYLKRFPSPPRNNSYVWTPENLGPRGFSLYPLERFDNTVRFNKRQLINYFMTQSNTIAAVESHQTGSEEIEHWLNGELSFFFNNEEQERVLTYGNWIRYLQKTAR